MADTPAQEAAAGVASDLLAELDAFTEEDEPTDEASAEVTDEQQQDDDVPFPEISWEIPEELRDVLEAPDFDEEEDDDEPVVAESQEFDEYDDPEKARMQKQLQKMQKRLDWAEEQKAKVSQKAWSDEARKYFQFSNPEVIQAKSRRAFLKEAQKQHQAVAKIAKPVFDALAAEKVKLKEEAMAEARAEAEQRWGRPTTGPTANVNLENSNTQSNARQRLEQGRNLTDVLKAKLRSGEVKI